MARIIWLLGKKLVSWVKGSGFLIHWKKLGIGKPDELVLIM